MGQVGPFQPENSLSTIKSIYLQRLGAIFWFQPKFLTFSAIFIVLPDFGGVQARWAGPPKSSILAIFTESGLFSVTQQNQRFQVPCDLYLLAFEDFDPKNLTGHAQGQVGRTLIRGQKIVYPQSIPYSTSIESSGPVDHENTIFEKFRPL